MLHRTMCTTTEQAGHSGDFLGQSILEVWALCFTVLALSERYGSSPQHLPNEKLYSLAAHDATELFIQCRNGVLRTILR